jgi:predicted phosphodiesterase
MLEGGIVLVHGGVRDVQQYMINSSLIEANAALLRADFPGAKLCFFGHSHEQRVYALRPDGVVEICAATAVSLDRDIQYFVNPGSVDASRKRATKLAECAVLDTDAWTIEFVRVPYDAASTEAKSAAFGYRIPPWIERVDRLRRRVMRLASPHRPRQA